MSANTGVVTHGGATHEVQQYYDSVIVQLPGTNVTKTTKYCFLSRVDPWDDPNTEPNEENSPPTPSLSQKSINDVFKNMFVIKRVYPQDMRPMIDRIDWTSGFNYAMYRDDIDIIARDSNGHMIYKFYVKNRFDQVFKCLWNNNGGPSTDEPYFQPGTLNSSGIYTGVDGYKWIYIYSIDAALKQRFLDDDWMPTPLANAAGIGANTVNSGNIPVVNPVAIGSGYAANTVIRITGANTRQALATAIIHNGSIVDYVVTDVGENYTSANVQIISTTGSGAIASANVSPINGHGSDPFEEFGAQNIMVTNTFTEDEASLIPTDINYRQIGFVINPVARSAFPNQCEEPIYSTTTDLVVSNGFDFYTSDEVVYQGTDIANATFSGTCLSFNNDTNVLRLINTSGTASNGFTLIGETTGTTRTVLNVSLPDYIPYSGYITYIENRAGTQRSSDGSEQVRLVVGFN
jgi:hypothetical protein